MVNYLKNYLCVLLFLILVEFINYSNDYNEVLILQNYVRYDIVMNNLSDSSSNNYEIKIDDNKYHIIYYRKSIFNLKFLEKIEYHGII